MSKIAVIGVGNMGYAYVNSIVNDGIAKRHDVVLFDVSGNRINALKEEGFSNSYTAFNDQLSTADIVVLAVKPQYFAEMALEAKPFINNNQLLVSIMAGVKAAVIGKLTGSNKIVRAMPNTPCMLNKGVTGFYISQAAKDSNQLSAVNNILKSTGSAVEVDTEEQIDTVTSVSGSGPAYFYYFIQQIAEQGTSLGLSEKVALELANKTMAGAFHMIENKGGKSVQDLIDAVTSKGGTTHAALNTMKENKVGENIQKAVKAAKDRAGELSDMIEKG